MADEQIQDRDRWLAENIKARRDAANMSQEDLADAMRTRGFKFSQATIWKIERADRLVRVSELPALAEALGMQAGWTELAEPPRVHRHRMQLDAANRQLVEAGQQIRIWTHEYLRRTRALAATVGSAAAAGLDPVYGDAVPPENIALIERMRWEYEQTTDHALALADITKRFDTFTSKGGWEWVPPRPEDFQDAVPHGKH